MRFSKTALKELSRLYAGVLRKCLWLNMLAFGLVSPSAFAKVVSENTTWDPSTAAWYISGGDPAGGDLTVTNGAALNITGDNTENVSIH